jgi:signal transduction histidine kinase/ligand-binding sensor domain-containing protein/AraC-like DNA-binding protein/DNA-binding NarL/FixJ family response regulator
LPLRAAVLLAHLASSLAPEPADASTFTAPGYVARHWSVADGLPVDSINAIAQSRDSFLWLATFDGLARFDGVRFVVPRPDERDPLPSNRWTYLEEGPDRSLWLATEQRHLVRYKDGEFLHYGPAQGLPGQQIVLITQDSDGLWLGTDQGLARFQDGRIVPAAPEVLRGMVCATARGPDGTRWAGVQGHGLVGLAPDRVIRYSSADGLLDNSIWALFSDRDGDLWIGTKRGLHVLRRGWIVPIGGAPDPLQVFFIQQDLDGTIWAGTDQGTYLVKGDALEAFRPEPRIAGLWTRPLRRGPDGRRWILTGRRLYREEQLVFESEQEIRSLCFDREGSLWIAPTGSGLYRLRPALFEVYGKPEGLRDENVYPILEDRDGSIWLGTLEGGLVHLLDGRPAGAYGREAGLPSDFVWALAQDRDGALWVGGEGLCRFRDGRCDVEGIDPHLHSGEIVRAIHEDLAGRLWVGTERGLFLRESGSWTRLGPEHGLPHEWVRVLHEDPAGRIWIGTNGGGLAVWEAGRIARLSAEQGLPSNLVRAIHRDERGVLWIGTENRGLCRLELRPGTAQPASIVSIRKHDGLFDDVVHQVLEDAQGRMWMNTNRGIFWVRRQDLDAFAQVRRPAVRCVSYSEQDGLRDREGNGGMQPAGIRASDGRLWFPTQGGAVAIDPERVRSNGVLPLVVVEGLQRGPAEHPVVPDSTVALEIGERDLGIRYTALSFVNPAKVAFRYRLWGFDHDWVDAGPRRTAFYTNLRPGRFRFQVLASNNDGLWNETGASLDIEVPSYFSETWTFYGLCALGLLLAGLGAARWRIRQLEARRAALEGLVTERTQALALEKRRAEEALQTVEEQAAALAKLDAAKSRFFADVSHELRTPFAVILGPLQEALGGAYDPGRMHQQLRMMERNAQRLLRLVNQILDLQKLEAGALKLDLRPRDLVSFARQQVGFFESMAESRSVRLTFRAETAVCELAFDADQLEKVLANLLSNALKFTPQGGSVCATVRATEEQAQIVVSDTGLGIPAQDLDHVFERFYRADTPEARSIEGTGLGLGLVRELVELHGGSIEVASAPGQGSAFTVILPRTPAGSMASAPEGARPAALPHPPAPSPASAGVGPWMRAAQAAASRNADEAEPDDRTAVLVVDDNADIRADVRHILEPAYRIWEAEDGARGLELALDRLPDVVVADVMMPRLDGLGLSRALRQDPRTSGVPVILLTARAEVRDQIGGLQAGADDYVTKPFDAGLLRARVKALLASRHRLREQVRAELAAHGTEPPGPRVTLLPEAEPSALSRPEVPAPSAPRSPAPAGPEVSAPSMLQAGAASRPGSAAPAAPAVRPRSLIEERVRAVILRNLCEEGFTVEHLASEVALSRSQLFRRLKEEADTTPSDLIRIVRLEKAAELLQRRAGNVSEVAVAVGFNSLAHFSRSFRVHFGVAPSEYARGSAPGSEAFPSPAAARVGEA